MPEHPLPEHPARSATIRDSKLYLINANGYRCETVTLTAEPGDRSIYWTACRALSARGLVLEDGWTDGLGADGTVSYARVTPKSDAHGDGHCPCPVTPGGGHA